MNPSQVSAALQNIVTSKVPDGLFMRATDADANRDVDNVDLGGKTLVIYNNLPEVTHPVPVGGAISREWPVELRILRLANFDDNTEQGDALRDICMDAADRIFDSITDIDSFPSVEEYTIQMLGEVKVYDKTLTGVRLSFTLHLLRNAYYC